MAQAQERTKRIMDASDATSAQLANALMPPSQDPTTWKEMTLDQQRAKIRDSLIRNTTGAALNPPPKWGVSPHLGSAGSQPSTYGEAAPPSSNNPEAHETAPHDATPTARNTKKTGPWALKSTSSTSAPVNEVQRRRALAGPQERTPPRPLSELDRILAGASDLLTTSEAPSPDPPAFTSSLRPSSNPAAVGAGADISPTSSPAHPDATLPEVSSDATDTNANTTPLIPPTAHNNPEPPTDTDTSPPPDVVMGAASDIVSNINALSSDIEALELGNYDDSFALLLPLAREVQQMQQQQSTAYGRDSTMH